MSSSHRWLQILKDTDQPDLSEQQRFWRSVAQLRLRQPNEALQTFEQLGSQQFKSTPFKLHAAELYLKNQLLHQGEQLLSEIYHKINQTKDFKQWLFIAKRYPNPSPELKNLLERHPNSKRTPSHLHFDDPISWQRAQKLDIHILNPDFYLAWIDYSLKHQAPAQTLSNILNQTLENLPDKSYLCYQLFQKLKNSDLWPELIDKLFGHQHRNHAQPELMWKQWWSACPISYRNQLRQRMSESLQRRPNMSLEKLLEKFSQ